MTTREGLERERRILHEIDTRDKVQSHPPIPPMGQFHHVFHENVTVAHLKGKAFEDLLFLGESRERFMQALSTIQLSPDEMEVVHPIIDLAKNTWTKGIIDQLVDIHDKIFPERTREERRKIRDEEKLKRSK